MTVAVQTSATTQNTVQIVAFENIGTHSFDLTAQGTLSITWFQPLPVGASDAVYYTQEYARIRGNFLSMERADVQALRTWLNTLDTDDACSLRARPVVYPVIENAYRSDGTKLPATFGTMHVMRWDSTAHADFDLLSDGRVTITRYEGDNFDVLNYMELSQTQALLLLHWLNGLCARGLL